MLCEIGIGIKHNIQGTRCYGETNYHAQNSEKLPIRTSWWPVVCWFRMQVCEESYCVVPIEVLWMKLLDWKPVWNVAPVTFTWQCVYYGTADNVTHILVFPEAKIQLTLDDDTAVPFSYRSAQWTEFVLHLYNHATPFMFTEGIKFVF